MLWLTIGVPALLGFGLGAGRSITMLGHLFYTNRGFEQNSLIALGLWIGLFFCALLLAGAFSV